MNDKKFKQSLKQPEVPTSLEKKIRDNWHAQFNEETDRRSGASRLLMSAVASIFVVSMALFFVGQQGAPNIVALAMQDIASDARHRNQSEYPFDDVMLSRLKMQGINPPLPTMPVKMAKYCSLNKTQAIHLRIAGSVKGEVHVFIRDGDFDIPAWRAEQGELNAMQWQIIHPRENMSVLVIRTADMNPQNVEALIQKMFYT